MVQDHVAERVNPLDGELVPLPHLAELGELLGHKGIGFLIGPDVRLPARMDVQAALADLLPLLYPRRGSGAAHGDMMKDGRDAVFERRGARLGDAVVGEADVEVAAGGREEEPVGAAPPKGRKGCQCPRLVEKSAAEPRADEDDANQAGDEPAVRAVSRWQMYYAHATFAWCCCVEECGVSEKRLRVVVVFFSPCQPWFGWDRECRMSNYVEAQNFWEQVEDQEHKMEFRNRSRRVRPRAMQVMGAQLIK